MSIEMGSGSTFKKVFQDSIHSLTYDDLILMPGYIDGTTTDINLSSKLTRNITLKTPFVSSPMDTVTESDMAIALALQGGIGIIHSNLPIEEQVRHVQRVKRYSNKIVRYPVCVKPDYTLARVEEMRSQSDFTSFPVIDEHSKLVGYLSRRDSQFVDDFEKVTVGDVMQTVNIRAINKDMADNLDFITSQMKMHRLSRLPITDKDGYLKGLVCRKDIVNLKNYPNASRDPQTKQLLVGAAVSTHPKDRERIRELLNANVDVIVIDSSQGNSRYQLETIQYIHDANRENNTHVEIIGGNVVTPKQAKNLLEAGIDGIRVGMGVGSICTTQDVCGVGRGQASAVYHISRWMKTLPLEQQIPIMADGGIANTASITKALSLGANCVMMGGMLAGTNESPGDFIYKDGVRLKKYRGMGSKTARHSTKEGTAVKSRYHSSKKDVFVPQGVTGNVLSKGSLEEYVPYLAQGVKHGFQNIGYKSIDELHTASEKGELKVELRSMGSQREGMVHHLYSYEK